MAKKFNGNYDSLWRQCFYCGDLFEVDGDSDDAMVCEKCCAEQEYENYVSYNEEEQ